MAKLFTVVSTICLLAVPMFAAQAFTTQPTVTVEQVRAKYPVPQTVSWDISGQAEDGDETINSFTLTITDNTSDNTVCTIEINDATATSLTVNKQNCDGLKVYSSYTASLIEHYVSNEDSRAGTDSFRTAPPKLKRLRIPNNKKTANSIRLKFNRGVNTSGVSMYLDYVVARRNNKSKIVANGADYTSENYIDIDELPAGTKLRVKVRLRSTSYGEGPYSAWKFFRT